MIAMTHAIYIKNGISLDGRNESYINSALVGIPAFYSASLVVLTIDTCDFPTSMITPVGTGYTE